VASKITFGKVVLALAQLCSHNLYTEWFAIEKDFFMKNINFKDQFMEKF
jgi:hypothetical protein